MRRSKTKFSEGNRAVEDERTSEAKWPQGAARRHSSAACRIRHSENGCASFERMQRVRSDSQFAHESVIKTQGFAHESVTKI